MDFETFIWSMRVVTVISCLILVLGTPFVAFEWIRMLLGAPVSIWEDFWVYVRFLIRNGFKLGIFSLFAIPTAVLAATFWWLVGTQTALLICLLVLLVFAPYWLSELSETCRALGSKHPWVSSINVCLVLSSAVILKALIFRPEGKVMIPGWEQALIVGVVLSSILFLINKIWIVSRPRSYFPGS